jgi:hypothetical protein
VDEILDQLKEIRLEQRAQGNAIARVDERLKAFEAGPPSAPVRRANAKHAVIASGTSAAIVVGIIEGLKAVLSK